MLNPISYIRGFFSSTEQKKKKSAPSENIEARYDLAQTTPGLQNHWAMADGLSADAANAPYVRRTLRERSRLECANNPHACGINRTLGNDVVGMGPRVQCLIENDADSNRIIQKDFAEWCKQSRFAKKLRMMRQTKSRDGEVFAMLTYNPKIKGPVKLDFKPIECDQITNPHWTGLEEGEIDGIRFDEYGNVTEYCLLRYHPGSVGVGPVNFYDLDWIPARSMIHLFLLERPGQHRGIPEMTSSLSIYAMVRNFAVATLDAARFAASPVGVVYSEFPVNPEDEDSDASYAPGYSFQVPQGALTAIGNGNKLEQLKPEHPTTTYGEFVSNKITEAARPISMSRNIATGDSSGYNFSSAKMDRSLYYKAVAIDQADLEIECVDVVFDAWWEEYRLVADWLPESILEMDSIPRESHWDQPVDADPQGTATARDTNLRNGMTSFQTEYAAIGLDAETEMRKQAQLLGLDYEVYLQKVTDSLFVTDAGSVPGDTAAAGSGPGAAADGATPGSPPARSAGVFTGMKKRDFSNNSKAIKEVLDSLISQTITQAMATVQLSRLGLTSDEVTLLLRDAQDGTVDTELGDNNATN